MYKRQVNNVGISQPLVNVRSQSQELHNNIQHPFAAVEKQEDESDSYTIDQIREKNNSFEKVLKPYPEAQNRRKIQSLSLIHILLPHRRPKHA